MNETGGSVEGGGGSSPHLECARPTDSSAFYLSLVLQICVRCQQWNPAAVIPRKKKKSKLRRDGCPLSSWKLCLLPVLSTASCQKLGRPQRYAGSQERDTGGKTREKDFTLLSIFKAFDLHSTSPFFAKSN